jgi:hypothetical protein
LPEVLESYTEPHKWDAIEGITFLRNGEMVKTPRRR